MADLGEDSIEVKPPIIMKVEAPPEDNNTITSQGDCSMNENEPVKSPVKPKKPLLATSRLNSSNSPLTMRSNVLSSPKLNSGVVLRPSALNNNKNPFALCPSRLNRADTNNGTETPKFVPLAATEASSSTKCTSSAPVASASNFVFGQNLHERVVAESEETSSTKCSGSSSNGTSDLLLFSSAAQKTAAATGDATSHREVKSLSESAREYEESRANKRKYEAVTVVTGEEDEQNVLQINCKLFAWEAAGGSWQERGRGALRLNDTDASQSRLVFRTAGSLRVVLNTKIWAEMTVDRASDKSLRLTAMDATGQIKVFLIMAGGDEVTQLQRLLQARVLRLRDGPESQSKKPALAPH